MLISGSACLPTSVELAHRDGTETCAGFGAKINLLMGGVDMAKSREKIQQLGFWDPELSKPDHDAVCLWAYENADSIFRTVCPERFDREWLADEVEWDHRRSNDQARAFMDAVSRPDPRVFKKDLEYVLSSRTGYRESTVRTVGYADLLIQTEVPRVVSKYKSVTTRGGEPEFDGYELNWSRGSEAPRILVEAKSVLPTLGELMRQIQLYRTAFGGKFVVVSPDDGYAKILAEQDVVFVKCHI